MKNYLNLTIIIIIINIIIIIITTTRYYYNDIIIINQLETPLNVIYYDYDPISITCPFYLFCC